MYELDIYFESETGEDMYVHRRWTIVPERDETVVFNDTSVGDNPVVWSGVVRDRLFVTDNDGTLRVQLHCTLPTVTAEDVAALAEDAPEGQGADAEEPDIL